MLSDKHGISSGQADPNCMNLLDEKISKLENENKDWSQAGRRYLRQNLLAKISKGAIMSRINTRNSVSLIATCLSLAAVVGQTAEAAKVIIIGASTAATYKDEKNPLTGWGEVFPFYLEATKFKIVNTALPGSSSLSFLANARWKTAQDSMQPGDFVFIQFAHNDLANKIDSATYKSNLDSIARTARSHGSIPVFVTSINPNTWYKDTLYEPFNQDTTNYTNWMLRKAAELKAPSLNLEKETKTDIMKLGQKYAYFFHYMVFPAGLYPNWANGAADGTHLQEMGALNIARQISALIANSKDSLLRPLQAAQIPCDSLIVKSSSASGFTYITKSGCYPPKAQVTSRVILDTVNPVQFLGWADANGKIIDTSRIHFDTMPKGRLVRTAVFASKTAELIRTAKGKTISFAQPVMSVDAISVRGQRHALAKSTSGNWRMPAAGLFILEAHASQGTIIREKILSVD